MGHVAQPAPSAPLQTVVHVAEHDERDVAPCGADVQGRPQVLVAQVFHGGACSAHAIGEHGGMRDEGGLSTGRCLLELCSADLGAASVPADVDCALAARACSSTASAWAWTAGTLMQWASLPRHRGQRRAGRTAIGVDSKVHTTGVAGCGAEASRPVVRHHNHRLLGRLGADAGADPGGRGGLCGDIVQLLQRLGLLRVPAALRGERTSVSSAAAPADQARARAVRCSKAARVRTRRPGQGPSRMR